MSFFLNSRITFRKRRVNRYTMIRFLGAFVVAFLINLAIVLMVTDIWMKQGLLASLSGVPLYTIVFYMLCEYWVFRHPHPIVHGSRDSSPDRAHD